MKHKTKQNKKKLISISRCHLIERELLSDYYYSTAAEKKENH